MQNQLQAGSLNPSYALAVARKIANEPLKIKNCLRLPALACLLALSARAQVNYAISGSTAYVTASPAASGDIVIASTYNGFPVTSIGNFAFEFCSGITNVTIPNSVTVIGDGAFFICSGLTNIVIPSSVTILGYDAFLGSGLQTATIPDSVLNIGQSAFGQCRSLTSVTIGKSVVSFVLPAFDYCSRLTNITVAAPNPAYSSLDSVLFNKAQTTLVAFPGSRGGGYTVPNSVVTVGDYAFYLCGNVTNVMLPDGVTTIGNYAFNYCTNLASVKIPDSVITIETLAFGDSTNLGPNIVIGSGVRNIYDFAFAGCSTLSNFTFRGNSPTGGDHMFSGVNAGAKVYYYQGTTGWGPTYYGLPTVMLQPPPVQIGTDSVGIKPGGFGFTLNGVLNQRVVIEASSDLLNWQPVWTNTLSGAPTNFVDQQSLNYPERFYRARSN
jgi:hypothetical protein